MKFMVYVLLAAVLCLSVAVGYQFEQIAQSRSEARARNMHSWHAVVCRIEQATVASASIPPAKKQFAIKFYDNLLVSIQVQPCGLTIPPK